MILSWIQYLVLTLKNENREYNIHAIKNKLEIKDNTARTKWNINKFVLFEPNILNISFNLIPIK